MKNKYFVMDKNGKVFDPQVFASSKACPEEFKIVIEREALGIKPGAASQEKPLPAPDAKSKYIYYANKLGFNWEPYSDIGFLQYDYKAALIMSLVKEYARKLVNELGIPVYEVNGANFFDLDYPVVKAYAGLFGDRLFKHHIEGKDLVMSYDSSYPQFNLARKASIGNQAMPFAHFSISDCYRYEQSGECMLLFRGRRFYMPDVHPYLRNIREAFVWYFKIEEKLLEAAEAVNRKYWNVVKVSSEENWVKYLNQIKKIAVRKAQPLLIEIRRDGVDRYWIIDVDYSIVDSFNQVREIGCIQIDNGNAKRLGIKYSDKQGRKHFPVIIHSAIPGGIERYLYMIFDNFKESFPFWLFPVQVRLLPVSEKHLSFVEKMVEDLAYLNLRFEIDDRAEPLSKRIKRVYGDLVPDYFVIGDKEVRACSEVVSTIESEQ
jgi:threonyl-tRNA synthetase